VFDGRRACVCRLCRSIGVIKVENPFRIGRLGIIGGPAMNRDERREPIRRGMPGASAWPAVVLASVAAWAASEARAQQPAGAPTAPSPAASAGSKTTDQELLLEIKKLRAEVNEARELKAQVQKLQSEVSTLRSDGPKDGAAERTATQVPGEEAGPGGLPTTPSGSLPGPTAPENYRYRSSGSPAPPVWNVDDPAKDDFPLSAKYRYNVGTGALGGGGYTHVATPDEEFTINLTNQITVDGTFFDRGGLNTIEKGFNVPFARTFLYGNITKNWKYQIGTQGFLGQFNLLDMWIAYSFGDALTVRFGKGLTPPLLEYYGWSPALEPVITNSPLFQLAGKRQLGVMATGNLVDGRIQYWAGVNNTGTSFWYDINRNVEFNGAVTFTPFAPSDTIFKSLGAGVGGSGGYDRYKLDQTNVSFVNGSGEPTTNSAFITSSGVPFFTYNNNVQANGLRSRITPHVFWYGRFSVTAELMNFSRFLTDGAQSGRSTQIGYYVNASYYLTGERDYAGNGFQGYSTVTPLRPLRPSKGEYGPGAWQVAGQFSELNVGTVDFLRGFAEASNSANRLDQVMVGLNWWPNKYTRLSFDYVWSGFNRPIAITGPNPIDSFNTFWMRFAMFF
jgi:phosphate-selective porin OprO and OprP